MLSRNLKNVLVVSVGFLFLFMAAGGLQNLQVREVHVVFHPMISERWRSPQQIEAFPVC